MSGGPVATALLVLAVVLYGELRICEPDDAGRSEGGGGAAAVTTHAIHSNHNLIFLYVL